MQQTNQVPETGVAVFAEGCFWHSELVFESIEGVDSVVVGYCGGTDQNPFYEKVSSGNTGHAESVMVYYDTTKTSYGALVNAFFLSHDPTLLNAQGMDVGTQYRSVAFYRTASEKETLEKSVDNLNKSGRFKNKIVTEIKPIMPFYRAEKYHQHFARKNPEDTYVKFVCTPLFLDFKMRYRGDLKSGY